MSNSDQYLFTEKGPDHQSIEFDFRLEFSDENHIAVATNNDCKIQQQQQQQDKEEEEEEEEHGASSTDEAAVKKEEEEEEEEECVSSYTNDDDSFLKKELKIPVIQQCDEVDDNDDGFLTPTSLEHKIPVIQQCPPAPKRKPKSPSSTKRKASPNIDRLIRFDLFKEMETLLFPVPPVHHLVDLGCKIKKAKGNNTK
ncbi:hypothetical protein FRX31_021802 [Thalictrum thalictroides]|uniref:Uncharacterized protein n=1 Tax=Thalictrum thalictroides TaxID=46969 RepID=A0A7J6VU46_THATH|nr:hypothetical protein FRX31_021802 [Thalictrum thalictroides]